MARFRDPYETLDVPRTASVTDIKKAYRKKALKLHPDVNKASDAKERFMECKNAYQEIMDSKKGAGEARYTNRKRADGTYTKPKSGSAYRPSQQKEEDFYGLGDLFRDLETEWKKSRGTSSEPKGLWEELADIGEEFVEFLEKNIGIADSVKQSSEVRADRDASATVNRKQTAKEQSNNKKPSHNDNNDIDAELEELRRKLGM
eukprot:jgi/Picsp_1/5485/NSC_02844-R1_chaperone protein